MTGLQWNQDVVACLKQHFCQGFKLVRSSGKPVKEEENLGGRMRLEVEF
jgi:hypothetical protein